MSGGRQKMKQGLKIEGVMKQQGLRGLMRSGGKIWQGKGLWWKLVAGMMNRPEIVADGAIARRCTEIRNPLRQIHPSEGGQVTLQIFHLIALLRCLHGLLNNPLCSEI